MNSSFANDLRQLADIIDANPSIGICGGGSSLVFVEADHQLFADRVRAMAKIGTVSKERGVSHFAARVRINESFTLLALDHSDEVACVRVQTGTRTVERPITVGVETVVEPVFEWVCPPSILATAS